MKGTKDLLNREGGLFNVYKRRKNNFYNNLTQRYTKYKLGTSEFGINLLFDITQFFTINYLLSFILYN